MIGLACRVIADIFAAAVQLYILHPEGGLYVYRRVGYRIRGAPVFRRVGTGIGQPHAVKPVCIQVALPAFAFACPRYGSHSPVARVKRLAGLYTVFNTVHIQVIVGGPQFQPPY